MADSPQEVEEHLEDEGVAQTKPLSGLVDALKETTEDSLRLVVRFDGESHEVVYAPEEVRAEHGDDFEDHVEWLVLKGLGDPADDDSLAVYGDLEATVRWYGEVVVAVYPTGEWSGVVAVLDRRDSPLVDAALSRLD